MTVQSIRKYSTLISRSTQTFPDVSTWKICPLWLWLRLWLSQQTGVTVNMTSPQNGFHGFAVVIFTSYIFKEEQRGVTFNCFSSKGCVMEGQAFKWNMSFLSAFIRSVPQCSAHSALSNSTQMLTRCFPLGEWHHSTLLSHLYTVSTPIKLEPPH